MGVRYDTPSRVRYRRGTNEYPIAALVLDVLLDLAQWMAEVRMYTLLYSSKATEEYAFRKIHNLTDRKDTFA
jgi:hypothetical protein